MDAVDRHPNVERALHYLRAIEQGATGPALAEFFTSDVCQREYPNRLVPSGVTRDLDGLLASGEKGQKVIRDQRYEVRTSLAQGDQVALEIDWSGTLQVPLGSLEAGARLRAAFAVFITFRDGRICAQHNYDCFDPF